MNLLIGSDNTHHQKGVSLWEQGRAPRLCGPDTTMFCFIFFYLIDIELVPQTNSMIAPNWEFTEIKSLYAMQYPISGWMDIEAYTI